MSDLGGELSQTQPFHSLHEEGFLNVARTPAVLTGGGRGAARLSAAHAKLSIYDIDRAKAQSIATDIGGQVTEIQRLDVFTTFERPAAEALAFLGITLQFRLNTGFGTAWKLVLPTA